MGCGDGKLLFFLANQMPPCELIGIDKSEKAIRKAKKLNTENGVCFYHQSFFVYNPIFADAVIIILSEVIEHLQKEEIQSLLFLVLEKYKPRLLLITTPNKSYNTNYDVLVNGLRHSSHIFELSDRDVINFTEELKHKFSCYTIRAKYCDKLGASHLIIAERNQYHEKN